VNLLGAFKLPGGLGMGDIAKIVQNPAMLLPMLTAAMPGVSRTVVLMTLSQELAAHASGLSLVSRLIMANAIAEKRDVSNDELQRLAALTDALFKVATRLWEIPDGAVTGPDLLGALGFVAPREPIDGDTVIGA
jgi:hypothetical protein